MVLLFWLWWNFFQKYPCVDSIFTSGDWPVGISQSSSLKFTFLLRITFPSFWLLPVCGLFCKLRRPYEGRAKGLLGQNVEVEDYSCQLYVCVCVCVCMCVYLERPPTPLRYNATSPPTFVCDGRGWFDFGLEKVNVCRRRQRRRHPWSNGAPKFTFNQT